MSEGKLQQYASQFLDRLPGVLHYHPFGEWTNYVFQANRRNKGKAFGIIKKAKARGCKSGQPDLSIYLDGGKTIFVELKTKNGRLSDKQKARKQELEHAGFNYYVVKANGRQDLIDQLQSIITAERSGKKSCCGNCQLN